MVLLTLSYYYQLVNNSIINNLTINDMKEKPEEIRVIFAQNIKKRRENLGLTQENLAEMTDLSVQTINTIEGCRMWISDKSITRLAKALDIEIFQLFMPNLINYNELEPDQISVLLTFWQKTKLVLDKMNSQIDIEFKDILKQSPQPKKIKKISDNKNKRNKTNRIK
ncbi:MAG: helix-turn-helix transcriptional regulator [Treponema sp.]|nr:helix-turn-helix transcriptional regulator [Treponema sp.]